MYGFIYETTCIVNGKKYIGKKVYGKSTSWKNYLGSGKILKLAIKKYGRNNFVREIICECETKEELCAAERYYIKQADAVNNPMYYNIASGGDGGGRPGEKKSESTKQKMSKAAKGNTNALGRIVSDDTRKKISESEKGKIVSKETREKLSIAKTGTKRSEYSKKKQSDTMRNFKKFSKPVLCIETGVT